LDWTECRIDRGPDDGLAAHSKTGRGGRDSNAKAEEASEAEDLAGSEVVASEALARTDADSRPFAAGSRPFVHSVAKPTEEDFEDAIVRAMLDGRTEVAEVLARALKARREVVSRNVLRMPPRPR
jgi:hypothetical protein